MDMPTGGGGRCPHEDCGCPRSSGQVPYCSPYCANAAENESLPGEADLEGACACGHAECRTETETGARTREIPISVGRG